MKWAINSERGDTIVEVLIAIAVIGTVLGSSAVIINKNVKTNLVTQERSQALKIAETQYEQVKVAVGANPTFFTSNDGQTFCIKSDGSVATAGCQFNGLYVVKINLSAASYTVPATENPQGRKVHINIVWDSASGSGVDTLDRWGEVYSNDYN